MEVMAMAIQRAESLLFGVLLSLRSYSYSARTWNKLEQCLIITAGF